MLPTSPLTALTLAEARDALRAGDVTGRAVLVP